MSLAVLGTVKQRLAMLCRRFLSSKQVSERRVIDEELLRILVCPLSKEPLRYEQDKEELVCDHLGVAYPVKNGVPILTPADGRLVNNQT